ncbi:MAG: helix-turn-helix transcriptional regulator [Pseudonocardia sp.]
MRASRLVSLLMLLQTRDRMTAHELAAALEVSVRTVYRDVESLAAAGVPVYGEPGHDGDYRLLEGYRTRLTGLTRPEAEALFLTGLPGAAGELGMGAAAVAARRKLMASMPDELRALAARGEQRFHLDAPSWYHEADRVPHLTAVAEAVWAQQPLRIRYLRWAQPHETVRTVAPHGLVLKGGRWYVVARSAGSAMRTYRVSRLLAVDPLGEVFEREADFDLAAHWADYLARFDRRRHRGTATLRLSPRGVERLPHLMEHAVAEAARRSAGPPDGDGWREVTIPVEAVDQAVPELLRLGADAEVLAPDELREHVIRSVRALVSVYGLD